MNDFNETERLVYEVIGNGKEILIAFHGFGQNGSIFRPWEEKLKDRYTIYAFDLFNHGKSSRSLKKLSKKDWKNHFFHFLEENQITRFSLVGYSLGGRFAISTALSFPEKTDEIILIAPDGIYLTIWFKLATTPGIRFFFKYLMLNPEKLEQLIKFNKKVKVVNKYIADFIRKELGSAENRKRVYISWNHFKTLGYKKRTLIKSFEKHGFRKRIILGSKDHVIHPKKVLPIVHKMEGFKVDILEKKHHQLLDQEVAELLMEKRNLQ